MSDLIDREAAVRAIEASLTFWANELESLSAHKAGWDANDFDRREQLENYIAASQIFVAALRALPAVEMPQAPTCILRVPPSPGECATAGCMCADCLKARSCPHCQNCQPGDLTILVTMSACMELPSLVRTQEPRP